MFCGGPGSIGPAWTRGQIEAPAGTKDMGGWSAGVYTAEQQARLGVDEQGTKRATVAAAMTVAPSAVRSIGSGLIGGAAGLGPAWTRGEIEKPAGSKTVGSCTMGVYTAEQQARLGVNEQGVKTGAAVQTVAAAAPRLMGGYNAIGPAWTRGEIEKPAGTKNMGSYTIGVYTAEQQARLGVNEQGAKLSTAAPVATSPTNATLLGAAAPAAARPLLGAAPAAVRSIGATVLGAAPAAATVLGAPAVIGGARGLGPAWTRGEIEKPAGEKNMGSYTTAVYTPEQMARLGVDEEGKKRATVLGATAAPVAVLGGRPLIGGTRNAIGPAWTRGEIERPAGEKNMGSYTSAVYTAEQQARLGVDEQGNKAAAPAPVEAAAPAPVEAVEALGPAWTRGEIEQPQGERNVGSSIEAVYTEEQQARLGVDEEGNKKAE